MANYKSIAVLAFTAWLTLASAAYAQVRPYIGYAYPAGGQQGTSFQVKLGGQGLDGVNDVLVSGEGVSAKVVEYHRRLNNQEVQLLNEQLRELRRATNSKAAAAPAQMMMSDDSMMMMSSSPSGGKTAAGSGKNPATVQLISTLEKRTRGFVATPASAALASMAIVEVTVAPDAPPGERQIRLATLRGVSNPLAFHVGQVPEFTRPAMLTATLQVLGKEASALRKRPAAEAEVSVTLPCTVNGQIASGEVNRYRFQGRKGQRVVITTLGRQLIPFLADAVPGWFQPVLVLHDQNGREVAYDDDYRFKPDPTIFYEVPRDGEYVLGIHDSIFRGREDFVYRITIGELPFVTSIFPLGGRIGESPSPKISGWNLAEAELSPVGTNASAGVQWLTAKRKGAVSNRVPFELGTLPEALEKEPNNDQARAQKVTLPVVINGRINKTDDWDVFQFTGKSNETVVVDVHARQLDSPLDSLIKLTDSKGKVLGYNDDHEDLGAGANTHHADSYFMAKLPADGTYYVHIGDTARAGGEPYAYRLRISPPQPDFALRVVPSSIGLRTKSSANLTVYIMREDGFTNAIKLSLKNAPKGLTATPVTITGTQAVARLAVRSDATFTNVAVDLTVLGTAKIRNLEIAHEAVPAEDRMQAFYWRHLVPADDLKALVFDPSQDPPPKRIAPVVPPSVVETNASPSTNIATTVKAGATNAVVAPKPKFTKQQIAGRLRQLKLLFEEGLLTEQFYVQKVIECEAPQ